MIDPNQSPAPIETYLQAALHPSAEFITAARLPQSTRSAPWLIEARLEGEIRLFVLRTESRNLEYECKVMQAVAALPFPSPPVYGWDPAAEYLGTPCFLCEYVEGESLLQPLLAGEPWAEALYLESVAALQAITAQDISPMLPDPTYLSTGEVLEEAWSVFQEHPHPLAERAYRTLKERMPELPILRFSNGDLWPDNFIVKDHQLAGVIDFESAGFSDPLYEFLLAFFVDSSLCGRGLEERYCERMGFDPAVLPWYHGLEYFDTLHYLLPNGDSFEGHTVQSLGDDLARWLEQNEN